MPRFKIRSGEKVIVADACLHHKGPLAFKGEMTLTNERVVWMPSGRLDKMAGAKAIGFSLERIEKVEVSGLDKMLHLTVGGSLFKFSGAGALRLRERIALHSSSASDEDLSTEEVDALSEKVLFQDDVSLYIKGNLSAKAHVVLTDLNLSIETKRSLETMLFSAKAVKTSVLDIEETVYSNLENKLHLTIRGETITLGGAQTSQLYLLMQSLEDRSNDSVDILQCDATHYKGPLAIKGHLLATTDRLLFCPTSQLDSLVGATTLTIKLSDVVEVALEGWPEQRLVVTEQDGRSTTLQVPEPGARLRELRELFLRVPPPAGLTSQRSTADDPEGPQRLLEELGIAHDENRVYLVEWGLRLVEDRSVQIGWFILTGETVRLVRPARGTLWQASVSSVGRPGQGVSPQVLVFDAEGTTHRFVTTKRARFVEAFWDALGQVRPETRYAFAKPNQPLRKVLGHHKTLNLQQKGQNIASLEDARVFRKETGDLKITGYASRPEAIRQGDSVHVEVAREHSRYVFHTIVREERLKAPGEKGESFLLVGAPQDIVAFSLRQHHRMGLGGSLLVWAFAAIDARALSELTFEDQELVDGRGPRVAEELLPLTASELDAYDRHHIEGLVGAGGPQLLEFLGVRRVKLMDVSLGGCGVAAVHSFDGFRVPLDRLLLKFFLPLEDKAIPVQARIVHHHYPERKDGAAVCGLQFLELGQTVERGVQQLVQSLEREDLRVKAESRSRSK